MEMERRAPLVREEFCEWRANELADSDSFLLQLSPAEQSEIWAVLGHLRRRGSMPGPLRRADVPLNGLCTRLAGLRDDIVFGRGFGVIRRIPVDRLGDGEALQLMCGLSAHIGRLRVPAEGTSPVTEWTGMPDPQADLFGLLCLSAAPLGTSLRLTSAVAVHNEVARQRPDLLGALYRRTSLGRPVFKASGRVLSARLGFSDLERHAVDDEQAEACALAHEIARDSALELAFEPGDLLFVNAHHVAVGVAQGTPSGFRVHDVSAVRGLDARSGRVGAIALSSPHIENGANDSDSEAGERAAA